MTSKEERLLELYLEKYITKTQYFKTREKIRNSTKYIPEEKEEAKS